jgi:hypothetical protein
VYRIQHSACFVGYENFQRDNIPASEDALSEQFASSQYCLGSHGLKIGQFSTFRIGVEFVNVKKIFWQASPRRTQLLNKLLCNGLLRVDTFYIVLPRGDCPLWVKNGSRGWLESLLLFLRKRT